MGPSRMALSPMDNIMPRFFARLIFCFRTKPQSDAQEMVRILQEGLALTCETLPVLATRVVALPADEQDGSTGRLALELDPPRVPEIVLNDLRDTWDYDELMEMGMPQDDMDGDVLFPRASAMDLVAGTPALVAQANVLDGGLLLSVGMFHSVIDGTSGTWLAKLWSQNVCRVQGSEQTGARLEIMPDSHRTDLLTQIWLREGNKLASPSASASASASSSSSPPSPSSSSSASSPPATPANNDAAWRMLGLNPVDNKVQPAFALDPEANHGQGGSGPEMRASVFYFSERAFGQLKRDANETSSSPSSSAEADADADGHATTKVSANDALMALLWKAILAARFPHPYHGAEGEGEGGKAETGEAGKAADGQETDAILDTTLDGRALFSSHLPWSYLGTLIFISTARMPIARLVAPTTSLAHIATTIRRSIDGMTRARLHEAYGLAAGIADYNRVSFPFASFAPPEICITSWIAWSLFDLNFGPRLFGNGGRPELLRVPRREFDAVCRRCVVLPLQQHGGFEVTISLPKEEMLRLEKDSEFLRYATFACH